MSCYQVKSAINSISSLVERPLVLFASSSLRRRLIQWADARCCESHAMLISVRIGASAAAGTLLETC